MPLLLQPTSWSASDLQTGRLQAIRDFRDTRMAEPLDQYLEFYEAAFAAFSDLLELTDDLTKLRECRHEVLTNKQSQILARYIASPPISEDDLSVLANTKLSLRAMKADVADCTNTVIDFILDGLDRERFPWIGHGRTATQAERSAATMATSAMLAFRQVETWRRNHAKAQQEALVHAHLDAYGFTRIKTTKMKSVRQGPDVGEYMGETQVPGGKADIVARLPDERLLLIECKVSNSQVNSYKRLINECGKKAQTWIAKMGSDQVVPMAVVAGVYSLSNLEEAQDLGLSLVWGHTLDPLSDFIKAVEASV